MSASGSDLDLAVALSLQDSYAGPGPRVEVEEKPVKGIVDESWELADPNPSIHKLFVEYDSLFFWGKLTSSGVAVDWSTRMTLCAGVCSYEGRGGFCSIRLSQPLLKLRPRRDLVETLLHEMIHAYLFVTHNNKDHDAHGPQFLSHMHRINRATGAKITVYHTFHREVKQYRQHWWKCDGPCRKRPPYYGMVMRATNRPPSSWDPWWAEHQRSCGGKYVKVKEPEGYGKKGRKKRDGGGKGSGSRDIRELLRGKVKGESAEETPSQSMEPPAAVFQGQGHQVGSSGGTTLDHASFREKILRAAEKREAENIKLRDSTVRGKRGSNDAAPPIRKRPKITDLENTNCIVITPEKTDTPPPVIVLDDEDSADRTDTSPPLIVLDDEEDARVSGGESTKRRKDADTRSESPISLEGEWLEDYKTCPVCGMGNIPSAIINLHVSLCLEEASEHTDH